MPFPHSLPIRIFFLFVGAGRREGSGRDGYGNGIFGTRRIVPSIKRGINLGEGGDIHHWEDGNATMRSFFTREESSLPRLDSGGGTNGAETVATVFFDARRIVRSRDELLDCKGARMPSGEWQRSSHWQQLSSKRWDIQRLFFHGWRCGG